MRVFLKSSATNVKLKILALHIFKGYALMPLQVDMGCGQKMGKSVGRACRWPVGTLKIVDNPMSPQSDDVHADFFFLWAYCGCQAVVNIKATCRGYKGEDSEMKACPTDISFFSPNLPSRTGSLLVLLK